MTAVAGTVQAFFTERLIGQRRASPHTITAYRDAIRLLLSFAAERTGALPCRLDFADLDAPVISAFLDHLEHERGNTIRTRNARLAAIHSLFGFAALRHPEHAADIERVLAIPPKRADQTIVTFLTAAEADALLAAPDRSTRTGRRDHAWMLLAVQTGLRASELTALTCGDVHLGGGAYVACHGKGRKDRITPLSPRHRRHLADLARRTRRDTRRPAVRHHPRRADEPRRPPAAAHPLRRHGRAVLPVPGQQERHPARPAALSGHGLAARRERHHRHRALAGPRIGHHHADLPASRHGPQAASPRPDHAACSPARAATSLPTSSLPSSKPCDYADIPDPVTAARQRQPPGIGITTVSG